MIKMILTLMLSLSFAQDDTVDGYVILADNLDTGGTHEGVQVTFYNLPGMDMETFGVSDEDGDGACCPCGGKRVIN
jgi:hypothetical protein